MAYNGGPLIVQRWDGPRELRSVLVGDERFPLTADGAMSELFYTVTRPGEGKVVYDSPESYFDQARPLMRPRDGTIDDDDVLLWQERDEFLKSPAVGQWRLRVSEIRSDPHGHLQRARARVRAAVEWSPTR